MKQNRQQQPQPAAAQAQPAQQVPRAPAQPAPAAPPLAVVPPPRPVSKAVLTDHGIELQNPEIRPERHVFVMGSREPTNVLHPARALIVHGVIVIDELELILPVAGTTIRVRK